MRLDRCTKYLLSLIVILLGVIAFRPVVSPPPSLAQANGPYHLYVEPGVRDLRSPDGTLSVRGKVVIDLRNGNIWGFPTDPREPYPIVVTRSEPPVSRPVLLGRFDLAAIDRR